MSAPNESPRKPYLGDDYAEAMDVAKVHAEELATPSEGTTLSLGASIGLSIVVALVFTMAESFFGSSMSFKASVLEGELSARGAGGGGGGAGGAAVADSPEVAFFKAGKKGYSLNCAQCHQPSGLGAAGQYPPLAGAEWVIESPSRLAAILLHSIEGPLMVKGVQWNNAGMPQWGKTLTDVQIAQIMTYIRGNKEWGNSAPPVSPDVVKAVREKYASRAKPWTQVELDAEKWDAAP